MTKDHLDLLTWAGLALAYAMGLTSIVLQIRGRKRPSDDTRSVSLAEVRPGGTTTTKVARADEESAS